MKITYNHVIKTLKFVTTTAFVIALGFKLYNIYKYGGPKKPEKSVEPNFEDDVDDGVYANKLPTVSAYDENDSMLSRTNTYSER
jgi:hypothetical protein